MDPDRIRHLATLARLELDETQIEPLRRDIEAILGHIGQLDALDLTDVEPTTQPALDDPATALRDDVVDPDATLERDAFLALTPAHEGPHLLVPRVIADAATDEEASS